MSTKNAQQVDLSSLSRSQLLVLLSKLENLLKSGVAAKLPDEGAKINELIQNIQALLNEDYGVLEMEFNSLSMCEDNKQEHHDKQSTQMLSGGDELASSSTTDTPAPTTANADSTTTTNSEMNNSNSPQNIDVSLIPIGVRSTTVMPNPAVKEAFIRKIMQSSKIINVNIEAKKKTDLIIKGRRELQHKVKNSKRSVVPLSLEEELTLKTEREETRIEGYRLGEAMAIDNTAYRDDERFTKMRSPPRYDDDDSAESDNEVNFFNPEDQNEEDGNNDVQSNDKQTSSEANTSKTFSRHPGPKWDVQDNVKDILELIPEEYKRPQRT
jgi:hypothetical protein